MSATTCLFFIALICVTRCYPPSQTTVCESSSNSLPDIIINNELVPAFESSPNVITYYLQGLSAGIAPKTVFKTVPNVDRLSWPYGLSTPDNIGLEELVPQVINYSNIFPSGLSSSLPSSGGTTICGSNPNLSGYGLFNYPYSGSPLKNKLGSTTICKNWPNAAPGFPYGNHAVNEMSWNVIPSRIPCL